MQCKTQSRKKDQKSRYIPLVWASLQEPQAHGWAWVLCVLVAPATRLDDWRLPVQSGLAALPLAAGPRESLTGAAVALTRFLRLGSLRTLLAMPFILRVYPGVCLPRGERLPRVQHEEEAGGEKQDGGRHFFIAARSSRGSGRATRAPRWG